MPHLDFTYHSQDQADIFDHPARFKIVRAGRRWGKTVGGATKALEICLLQPKSMHLWVDVTQLNISRYWSEVFQPKLPEGAFKWSEQRKIAKFQNGSQIVFASAERPQNMEGFAYDYVWLNEAGIILAQRPRMWTQSIRPMTIEGRGARVCFIGTPKEDAAIYRQLSERAREADWEEGKHDWIEFHRSSYDNPTLTYENIAELSGEMPHELHRQEIYAEWAMSDAGSAVIPYNLVIAATERDIGMVKHIRPKWGVDVAGGGADRSTLAKRCANHLLEPIRAWREGDLMRFSAIIRDEYDATEEKLRPSRIFVDANGLGKGVHDRLREWGLPSRGIMVQESASSKDRYFGLRDELWFRGREWFEEKTCYIPKDKDLLWELTTPLFTLKKKIKVESKADLKRRGARSPDLADAFLLTFAGGPDRTDSGLMSHYDRPKRSQYGETSWMSN